LNSVANDAGRHIAVDKAIRTERHRLLDFIRQRVRVKEDAEDILQDVFYQLAANYSVAEPIENLASWLFTVARNRIIDWYRKRKPQVRIAQGSESTNHHDDASGPLNLQDILFDPSENPDVLYARSLVWTQLADALDELPEQQREVFAMHELEGKSFKEIADITGESINTLLSRKHYAILFLRERLRELYGEIQNL
jgi:RNA polymerase sigma factor (sigma-70 family)